MRVGWTEWIHNFDRRHYPLITIIKFTMNKEASTPYVCNNSIQQRFGPAPVRSGIIFAYYLGTLSPRQISGVAIISNAPGNPTTCRVGVCGD